MKKTLTYLFSLLSFVAMAQIKGKITDIKNNPLASVNIYLENAITGTTSNSNGEYLLELKKTGTYTVIFQFLGYKSIKKTIIINAFPYRLDVQMNEEEVILNEVAVNAKENPALQIIRNVIANKEKNTDKFKQFTANFYSRGLFKIKNAPKKFLGQEIGDLGGGLDSTRTGIFYLSETISKIYVQKTPKNFKEHIIASKVSGKDNGISFNQAQRAYYNFYENQIPIGNEKLFSPIANYAFSYYTYKLEGVFYDKNNKLINKIKVIPRRENDRVFKGHIYIVEEDWAIYGVDFSLSGKQIGIPALNDLVIKQNFNYAKEFDVWIQILQTIDFDAGMLGFNFNGRFSAAYSNYNFNPNFNKNTFNNEVISFEKEATKKDYTFWNNLRSVPLTQEEKKDYTLKDSIKIVRKSKKYLDSIDKVKNKFSILDPLLGYNYQNSYKKWSLNVISPLRKLTFNTVQGWNASVGLNYTKRLNEQGKQYRIHTNFNYGFSDKRLRPTASFTYKWNNFDRPIITISSGITTAQFNYRNPISGSYNTFSSIFYERNYIKIYEKAFANISFSKEITNGVRLQTSLEYADRKPLTNTTDYSVFNKEGVAYTSNDPQNPSNFSSSFTRHQIWKADIGAIINFGNKFMSYPNAKYNMRSKKYPQLFVGYRKTFGAGDQKLHSDFIYSRIRQDFSLGNFGNFKYNIRGGVFLEKKDIPFMDYAHPNGNKIRFSPSYNDYTNHFNLLDYYALSSNDKYAEMHMEHNFRGFVLSKIPLLNQLNFHLVIGTKGLFTAENQPYSEYSIGLDNLGWGKWRFLRVDYVRSNFAGIKNDGFVIGINIPN